MNKVVDEFWVIGSDSEGKPSCHMYGEGRTNGLMAEALGLACAHMAVTAYIGAKATGHTDASLDEAAHAILQVVGVSAGRYVDAWLAGDSTYTTHEPK